jgi:protein-S-isoprenylcysteine O-methyltransferase Ste14
MIVFAYLFGYSTLLVELIFFHVPSVANTQNFFKKNKNYDITESQLINKIYAWSYLKKIIILALPFVLINLYFLLPFLNFVSDLHENLLLLFKPNCWTISFGVLLVITGRIVTFGSMLFMRRENKQVQKSFKLHTTGIFKYTRNPGLDGMFIFFLGFSLLFPSVFMFIGLLFYFFYMQFRVKIEEEFLKQLYKEQYLDYMKKTNRFFLF